MKTMGDTHHYHAQRHYSDADIQLPTSMNEQPRTHGPKPKNAENILTRGWPMRIPTARAISVYIIIPIKTYQYRHKPFYLNNFY